MAYQYVTRGPEGPAVTSGPGGMAPSAAASGRGAREKESGPPGVRLPHDRRPPRSDGTPARAREIPRARRVRGPRRSPAVPAGELSATTGAGWRP